MSHYLGDFSTGKTIRVPFNSKSTSGVPTSLSSGAVTIRKDGADVTPSGGVTLATDVGAVTGLNIVTIDMSVDIATFTPGSEYSVRMSGSSAVGGVSVVGDVVGQWSVFNRADLTQRVATAQAGGASTITLDSGASTADGSYVGHTITIVSGTGATSSRQVISYVGSTRVATVNKVWNTNPDSTSVFAIYRTISPVIDAVNAVVLSAVTHTGAVIPTVTNLTNAPTAGDFTATMKTSLNAATPAVTVSDKTGFSLSQAFPANFAALGITVAGKISGVVLTDTLTTYTNNTPQTGDNFARTGVPVGASISADIQTRSTFAGGAVASVTGAVGSVTGSVGGSVVGSTGSVTGNLGGNVNGNVTGSTGSVLGSVGSVTGPVGSVTGAVGSVTGSVGGSVVGSVASVAGAVGSVAGNLGGDVAGKVLGGGSGTLTGDGVRAASVTGAVGSVTGAVGSVTGSVGGNVVGTVGSVSGSVGSVAASVTVGGYASGQDPATLVLDVAAAGHNTAASMGAKINSAASAGDPWASVLPGSYVSGTAGNILGNKAGFLLAAAGLDAVVVESGINARQALSGILAATAGKSSGLDTATATFYAAGASGTVTARIVATVTADGNRTATTLTLPS